MSAYSDNLFQVNFSYPENQNIKKYVSLKIFETGKTFWSYWDDTIEFAEFPTVTSSEDKSTEDKDQNKICQQKVLHLLTNDVQKSGNGSPQLYKKKVDIKKHLRKEGNVFFLNERSFKKSDMLERYLQSRLELKTRTDA